MCQICATKGLTNASLSVKTALTFENAGMGFMEVAEIHSWLPSWEFQLSI